MIDEEIEEEEKAMEMRKVLLYLQWCLPRMLRVGDVLRRKLLEEGM